MCRAWWREAVAEISLIGSNLQVSISYKNTYSLFVIQHECCRFYSVLMCSGIILRLTYLHMTPHFDIQPLWLFSWWENTLYLQCGII